MYYPNYPYPYQFGGRCPCCGACLHCGHIPQPYPYWGVSPYQPIWNTTTAIGMTTPDVGAISLSYSNSTVQ